MTPEQITSHLASYRELRDRIASEERERMEREQELFRQNQESCRKVLQLEVEPLLKRLSDLLREAGHQSVLLPVEEAEHTTRRTNLRSSEYATAISVEQPKGSLTLRVVAKPDAMRVSSFIGVPHGTCSSVFHVMDGPLNQAEEVTNHGITDFVTAAFPLRRT